MTDETPTIEQPRQRPTGAAPAAALLGATACWSASPAASAATSASTRSSSGSASLVSLFFGGLGRARLRAARDLRPHGWGARPRPAGRRAPQRAGFWRGLGLVAIARARRWRASSRSPPAPRSRSRSAGASRSRSAIDRDRRAARPRRLSRRRPLADPAGASRSLSGAGVASAADLDFKGGIGEREHHPLAAAAIPADGYRLGVGQPRRGPARPRLEARRASIRLKVELGAGQADVFVPERVCVTGTTHVGRRRERGGGRAKRRGRRRPHGRRRLDRRAAARDRRRTSTSASCGSSTATPPTSTTPATARGRSTRTRRRSARPRRSACARPMKVDPISLGAGRGDRRRRGARPARLDRRARPLARVDRGRADRRGRRDPAGQRAASTAAPESVTIERDERRTAPFTRCHRDTNARARARSARRRLGGRARASTPSSCGSRSCPGRRDRRARAARATPGRWAGRAGGEPARLRAARSARPRCQGRRRLARGGGRGAADAVGAARVPRARHLVERRARLAARAGRVRRGPAVERSARRPPAERAARSCASEAHRGAVSEQPRLADLYSGVFGVLLVVGAALLFLSSNHILGGLRDAALTAVVVVVAVALILAPFLWRLGRNLAAERAERIRSQERAELAAHLHDSVLQTLTLMQKRADDPREVAALARRQERELRDWLAGDGRRSGERSFAAALRAAAEEVEDDHRRGDRGRGGRRLRARRARRGGARRRAGGAAERRQARRRAGADPRLRRGRRRPRSRSSSATAGPGSSPPPCPRTAAACASRSSAGWSGRAGARSVRSIPGGGTEVGLAIARDRAEERSRMSAELPSVVIVDDHELFRAGVRAELEGLVEVRADAGTVEEAVAAILREKPDVVLLDVHMPGGGGVEVIRQVGARAAGAALPRPVGLRRRRGRDRGDPRRRPRLRDEVDLRRGARGRDRPGRATATRSSRRGWRASCSTPSRARSRRPRSTPSSTS